MSKRRACCVNGERHKIRKMRRYAYKSSPQVGVHSGGRSEAITYRVLRLPRQAPLPGWFDEDWDEHEWLELLQREAQEVPGQLEIDYPPPPPPEDLMEMWESTLADAPEPPEPDFDPTFDADVPEPPPPPEPPSPDDGYEVLCLGGHWVSPYDDSAVIWEFRSARTADDMVRRLNAWMPVHRDKWLGLGAVVLLAAAFTEAVMAVVTGIHVHW
ncbi:MAG: hypothetical protein OXI97_18735 [Acidimicrobiaceae bacterium]|nr:hypothetical protein [Acidimicrobiaceae bacterium]